MTFMTLIGEVGQVGCEIGWMFQSPSGDIASGPRIHTTFIPTFDWLRSASIQSFQLLNRESREEYQSTRST